MGNEQEERKKEREKMGNDHPPRQRRFCFFFFFFLSEREGNQTSFFPVQKHQHPEKLCDTIRLRESGRTYTQKNVTQTKKRADKERVQKLALIVLKLQYREKLKFLEAPVPCTRNKTSPKDTHNEGEQRAIRLRFPPIQRERESARY